MHYDKLLVVASSFKIGIQFEQEVINCDVLIYFDVPDEIMTERLIKRGETSGRIDDNEETIRKRLETFHEQTTPILGYYGKQGKLVTIDANRQPTDVFNDVEQALEGLVQQKQVGKLNEYVFLKLFSRFILLCSFIRFFSFYFDGIYLK